MFTIDVMLPPHDNAAPEGRSSGPGLSSAEGAPRTGVILVIEDDTELRELLGVVLKDEGHFPILAPDGAAALDLLHLGALAPDLILADYNLPNGLDGLLVAAKIRETLHSHVPVVVLTGDISTDALQRIASQDCVQLNKPVKASDVMQAIRRLPAIS